jgi:hypothetical protein
MQRRTNLLLGTLLVAGVVAAVWLVWFRPRGYTASDLRGGTMAVEKSTVQYLSRNDGLFVVVWSDLFYDGNAGFGTEAGSSTNGRIEWHSTVKAGDGRAVQLKVGTTDGKAFTVTVNGKEYGLDDGALFLVQTRGASAKVTQVKQDLSALPPTSETWQRLAKESPEVNEFLTQVGAK